MIVRQMWRNKMTRSIFHPDLALLSVACLDQSPPIISFLMRSTRSKETQDLEPILMLECVSGLIGKRLLADYIQIRPGSVHLDLSPAPPKSSWSSSFFPDVHVPHLPPGHRPWADWLWALLGRTGPWEESPLGEDVQVLVKCSHIFIKWQPVLVIFLHCLIWFKF